MNSLPSSSWTRSKLRHLLCGAGAVAGLAGLGQAAWAQGAAPDNTSSTVKEIIVTGARYVATTNTSATKIAIPLLETPQSITVINRDQIDMLDMQNLSQAVRYTSGVVGENYGADPRYDWLTLRGFQPVEYIDGLQAPINSVTNVGIDLWGADSVEVLKGPSGVLYGQSPPGGIVNVTTRRPQAQFGGELQAQYGSFDNREIAGDITGTILGDGVLEGRLTFMTRDGGTQTEFVGAQRNYIAPALTWNIDPATHLTLLTYFQGDRIHGDGGGFLPYAGTAGYNPNGHLAVNFNAGDPDYNSFDRAQYGVGYSFEHRFNGMLTFKQDFKYSSAKDDFHSLYGAGLQADNETLTRYIFVYPEDTKQVAVDSRLEIRGETGPISHVGLVGVDYRDLDYKTEFGFAVGPSLNIFHPVYGQTVVNPTLYPDVDENEQQVGVYAQDEMKLGHWRLTLSAREDWLTTTNAGSAAVDNTAFSYRAGLSYLLPQGIAPYFAYSTSFLPTAGATYGGQPFVPSTGDQAEFGVKYEPRFLPKDMKVFVTAAAYDLVQDHVLANDPNHLFFSVQTGQVEVKGVELEAVARLWDQLNLNAAYGYTDAKVTKNSDPTLIGKDLPIVPPNKLSALADYTFKSGPLLGFGFGMGVRYLSSTYGDPENQFPTGDVTLFDALLHYNYDKWRLSVNGSNIFDKIYVERCTSEAQCFYGLRRNVMVTLDRKF